MNIKPDEIMHNYATIVEAQDAAAEAPTETPWHGEIQLEDARVELEVEARPVYLENIIVSNAAEERVEDLKKKKHPVPKEDMIEKAHPDSVYVSNALGDGGLVENQNEQQAKIIEIINKMPSGNHIHLYAEAIVGLQKIAAEMEGEGLEKESILIDSTLAELAVDLKKKVLNKEAGWFIPGLLWGLGLSGGGALLSSILGVQEDIAKDSADLLSNIRGWMNDAEYQQHRSVIDRIYRNATTMQMMSRRILSATSQAATSKNPALENQVNIMLAEFAKLLSSVDTDVKGLAKIYPGMTGLDFQRTMGLIRDLRGSLGNLQVVGKNVAETMDRKDVAGDVQRALQQTEQPPPAAAPAVPTKKQLSEDSIKEIQAILKDNPTIDFGNKSYRIVSKPFNLDGTLNPGTKDALHNLASAIRKRFGVLRNLPGSRLYNATPAQIRDLIDFANDPWSRLSEFKLSKEVYPDQ